MPIPNQERHPGRSIAGVTPNWEGSTGPGEQMHGMFAPELSILYPPEQDGAIAQARRQASAMQGMYADTLRQVYPPGQPALLQAVGVHGLYAPQARQYAEQYRGTATMNGLHGANLFVSGMGATADEVAKIGKDVWDFFASSGSVSDKVKDAIGKVSVAAKGAGVDLSADLMGALISKMRPTAAKALGKPVDKTTDEDVLAYIAGLPTQQLTANLTEIAEAKANTMIAVGVAAVAVIGAAIYFGLRGRKSGSVKANRPRKRHRR